MWNQSFDAAFMVPTAVSLGFGVLFATFITLILVPTSYIILDDAGREMRGVFGRGEPAAGAMPSGAVREESAARRRGYALLPSPVVEPGSGIRPIRPVARNRPVNLIASVHVLSTSPADVIHQPPAPLGA